MSSLIGGFFKDVADSSADETLALSALGGAAASAGAYLNAAVQATTPEVRRLFVDYLLQTLTGQEALVGLALKEGWMSPYESQESQVQIAYRNAQNSVEHSQEAN